MATLKDLKRQAMESSLGMANSGLSISDLEMLYWQKVIDTPPVDLSEYVKESRFNTTILGFVDEITRLDNKDINQDTAISARALSTDLGTTNTNVSKLTTRVEALENPVPQ